MTRFYSLPRFAALAALIVTGLAVPGGYAQEPDNTKVNKGDADRTAPTADHQKDNHNDRYLTQQIRKAVIADKSLSTYAHNVKIISQNGAVTLRGPVRSDDEKHSVVSKAEAIAGSGHVTDELSVKSDK
jgi:hyperosmotically inducible protein